MEKAISHSLSLTGIFYTVEPAKEEKNVELPDQVEYEEVTGTQWKSMEAHIIQATKLPSGKLT